MVPKKVLPVSLAYSSLELERDRHSRREKDRRRAIEDYNIATFGERRPLLGALGWLFEMSIVFAVVLAVLPHPADLWAGMLILSVYRLWEFRRLRR